MNASPRLQALDVVLRGLMRRYQERVPDVKGIIEAMVDEGLIASADDIENDHIAFRTMGVPSLGIDSLERIFLHFGYQRRDCYLFTAKKLIANWYSPPQEKYPRIFISELSVEELSPQAEGIILWYTSEVEQDPVDDLDLDDGEAIDEFLHRPLWRIPTWADYQRLLEESEYAAWVIYNRYYLNHFTVSVHNLPAGYRTIGEFNGFLERRGFQLNDAGGKIKVSQDGLYLQSSTVAALVEASFDDGHGSTVMHMIAGSYVEFSERRVRPEFAHLPADQVRREHRRDGFEASSADKIFESTYRHQTERRRGV